jgi:hypothetical protein
MNVLTAATPGLDTAVERALAWATAAGATTVHRADTAAGTVTIAGELGGAATFHPLGTGAAAGLGPHAAADIAATSPPTTALQRPLPTWRIGPLSSTFAALSIASTPITRHASPRVSRIPTACFAILFFWFVILFRSRADA